MTNSENKTIPALTHLQAGRLVNAFQEASIEHAWNVDNRAGGQACRASRALVQQTREALIAALTGAEA